MQDFFRNKKLWSQNLIVMIGVGGQKHDVRSEKMPHKTTAAERKNPEMGKRLAQKRVEKGYTQAQMAEIFGISEVSWRKYEKGNEIASGILVQICAILECSPNWLLGVKDVGMHLAPDSLLLKQLRDAFDQLNETGQQEAVKRVQELTHVPTYVGKEKNGGSSDVQKEA